MERRTSLLDLHPAGVLGRMVGADAADAGPALRDAEPDTATLAPGRLARLRAAFRRRREKAKPAVEIGR